MLVWQIKMYRAGCNDTKKLIAIEPSKILVWVIANLEIILRAISRNIPFTDALMVSNFLEYL